MKKQHILLKKWTDNSNYVVLFGMSLKNFQLFFWSYKIKEDNCGQIY